MSSEVDSLSIAIAQLSSAEDQGQNVNNIVKLIARGKSQGAQLIVFPENSIFFRIQPGRKLDALEMESEFSKKIQEEANRSQVDVLVTTPVKLESGRIGNSTIFYGANGAPRILYSKIHMFDVDVEGAPSVRESEHFDAGSEPALFDYKGWRFGLSVCYDLRFAELYSKYVGADVILVPSAFLVPTGQAHWEVLLRARAIESQAYVLAPAQVGPHEAGTVKRLTYGHTLAVSPWGEILLDLKDAKFELGVVRLTRDELERVRKQIPMYKHRRL